MSKKLDATETAINSGVTLAISFGVPLGAALLGAGPVLVGGMYFVLSTGKMYVIRRAFRRLEEKYGNRNHSAG